MIKNNKSFIVFLISQIIFKLGDAFHFIAIAALLIKITGSGTSASFAVVCTPISSFFLSQFAGSMGDRFNEKKLLVILGILKSIITILFIKTQNVWGIYILMILVASLEILYNPPKNKIVTRLLNQNNIMMGNSALTGITGFAFIIGPIIAGNIIDNLNINIIFKINVILYTISSIILLFIKIKDSDPIKEYARSNIYSDMKKGFKYFRSNKSVKQIVLTCTIVNLTIASVNIAFYSFAFDILKINSQIWGIMMSIFYGTSLIAMIISIYFSETIKKFKTKYTYILISLIAIVWILYSSSKSLIMVLSLQFIEGILVSLFTINISTEIQTNTNKKFIARIIGINDIFNNLGKLISILFTYIILIFHSARIIFVLNFFILIIYINYKAIKMKKL